MTPIESPYDVRFLTLVSVAMDTIEELSILTDKDPELILAESLFRSNKRLLELGTRPVANKLLSQYSTLNDAIT